MTPNIKCGDYVKIDHFSGRGRPMRTVGTVAKLTHKNIYVDTSFRDERYRVPISDVTQLFVIPNHTATPKGTT